MPSDNTFEDYIKQTELDNVEEWIVVWSPDILGSFQQVKAMQALDHG